MGRTEMPHRALSALRLESVHLAVTCHNDAPEPVAGKPVSEREVMAGFAHVHARAQDIIRHGKNWRLWVLCDRDPHQRWVDGRVALLGDAAHPMLQYFAQGACMALEDAVCLSHMLEAYPDDQAAALEHYCAQRFPRTARVQLQSRLIGEHIYHPAGEHARLRNAIMREKTSEDYYDDLAWLYGGAISAICFSLDHTSPVSSLRTQGDGFTFEVQRLI